MKTREVRGQWSEVRLAGILCFVLALGAAHAAPERETRFERTFADAARAYDENRLPEAIAGWQALVDENQALPEVLFNLGNAYYRHGQLGEAMRAYRAAQRRAPRDPDLRANLGFAAQSAGVVLPVRGPLAGLLLDFSRGEWLAFGTGVYWLLAVVLAGWILRPRFRALARPLAAGLAVLLLLTLAGLYAHRGLQQIPECVVMVPDQQVRSSPLETATPLLAIPAGAIVRQLDERGSWHEIRYDTVRGWLPAATLARVP